MNDTQYDIKEEKRLPFTLQFKTTLRKMPTDYEWLLFALPVDAAEKVQAHPKSPMKESEQWAVSVTINAITFEAFLTPTPEGGFFVYVPPEIRTHAHIDDGSEVDVSIQYV